MEKYEVIGTLGEGSFGRVYKAKQRSSGSFVALKVISKRGRSVKELKGFRRECEIQRDLHHPNIIQMLDSFETENEIVVITEFAHKELTGVLGKVGYLSEDKVQKIVWDLVSALYYLHSNRVLHRDLKPQNILLDINNAAKLCDFGFARNMSTGTHVLTSIKGTPLYMAPELIDEQPYDYTADLWSLGCIIYELLMGSPPFCTASILHLIRLIRHEQIQWPTFLSDNCISFLKGLLQKNPLKRLTWEEILEHPFVKGHIIIVTNTSAQPLTRPLSPNTSHAKEQQRKESIKNKLVKISSKNNEVQEQTTSCKPIKMKTSKQSDSSSIEANKKSLNQDSQNNNVPENSTKNTTPSNINGKTLIVEENSLNLNLKKDNSKNTETVNLGNQRKSSLNTFNFIEDNQPIETDEWIVFLTKTIQEVINGEMISLTQSTQTNVLVSPLKNPNASPKVISFVTRLLSIPFVVKGVTSSCLLEIRKVYSEVKVVPNLVYAIKLLLRDSGNDSSSDTTSPINSPLPLSAERYRRLSELTNEDFQTLEYIFMLIAHLVHLDDEFLIQFCDAVVVLSIYLLMKLFLSFTYKTSIRIVTDILAVLTRLMSRLPENSDVIEKTLLSSVDNQEMKQVNFVDLMRHSDSLLRERTCYFLIWFSRTQQLNVIKMFWNFTVKDTLEALVYDSIETVRNAAEYAVSELKNKDYYKEVK
ncbi:serine/threonine-protein kinase fused isoform X1 [Diorhabda carinulata]|uniref:serine/threonine-protein kinase fused isoform X1 n=2 Tax=Diorhabda carinulata TaxID=1163345 RepID=UPI0025A0C6C3|nr:serine/threonine-protein kinase fused isoform X1 [Diorhabda carinulata]